MQKCVSKQIECIKCEREGKATLVSRSVNTLIGFILEKFNKVMFLKRFSKD